MSRRSLTIVRLLLIFAITFSLLTLLNNIHVATQEYSISLENVSIMDNLADNESLAAIKNKISKFDPDSCKLVEVFDKDFKSVFRLQFSNMEGYASEPIQDHPEIIETFKKSQEGYAIFQMHDNVEEHVYFQWFGSEGCAKYLVIIILNNSISPLLFRSSILCYVIIALMFILLFVTLFSQYSFNIKYYKDLGSFRKRR